MGCDIHLSIEYRYNYENHIEGKAISDWMCWAEDVAGVRDYGMFGYLAGVRTLQDEYHTVVKPRGVPKNIGFRIKDKIDEIGSDGHSHSWLTPKEYSMACSLNQLRDPGGPYSKIAGEWVVLREVLNTLEKQFGKDNVRLIMFFDN